MCVKQQATGCVVERLIRVIEYRQRRKGERRLKRIASATEYTNNGFRLSNVKRKR
jgi:hypothetical protein